MRPAPAGQPAGRTGHLRRLHRRDGRSWLQAGHDRAPALQPQRERCLAIATVKGWSVEPIHIYADEGLSGTKDATERLGLAALLAAVGLDTVTTVIMLSLDRLDRKTRIVLDPVDHLTAAGAQLVSCKESLDTSTPTGHFVVTPFGALSQLERDRLVERTTLPCPDWKHFGELPHQS